MVSTPGITTTAPIHHPSHPPIPSLPTSTLYHGITVRDAVLLIHSHGGTATPAQVRKWVQRGQVQRTRDGQIDPFTLVEWWQYRHAHTQAHAQGRGTRKQRVA